MQPFRYPLTSQPQSGARIKWSNPITRDLVFDFEACAGQVNLATGIKGTLNPSGISTTAGRYGIERTYSGSQAANACAFGYLTVLKDATKTTFDILVKFNSGNPTARIATQWDGGNQNWDFEANAGTLIWIPCDDVSGNRTRFDLTGAFPAAGYYRIQAIWLGGAAKKLVINGVDRTASITVQGTAGSILSGSFDSWQIGSSVSQANLNGSVVWTRAWKRALSNAELKYITDNPWQLLSNSESPIFIGGGAAPSGLSIIAELATASASGHAATVNLQSAIHATLATATASGFTANVGTGNAITATLATATASGQTATVNRQSNITATQAVASASGNTATVNRQLAVVATLATATASGQTATVNIQRSVAATQAAATATGYTANVQLGNDLSISATQAAATASGFDAAINRQLSIAATLATATASGFDASISNGASIAASYGLASADGYQAQVNLQREIAASLATASASGFTAAISTSTGTAVWPTPDQVLSGITYGPTGADYTGTATAGGYPSAADIAAAVRADLSAELARIDAAISSRATVAAIMGATAP